MIAYQLVAQHPSDPTEYWFLTDGVKTTTWCRGVRVTGVLVCVEGDNAGTVQTDAWAEANIPTPLDDLVRANAKLMGLDLGLVMGWNENRREWEAITTKGIFTPLQIIATPDEIRMAW